MTTEHTIEYKRYQLTGTAIVLKQQDAPGCVKWFARLMITPIGREIAPQFVQSPRAVYERPEAAVNSAIIFGMRLVDGKLPGLAFKFHEVLQQPSEKTEQYRDYVITASAVQIATNQRWWARTTVCRQNRPNRVFTPIVTRFFDNPAAAIDAAIALAKSEIEQEKFSG